MSVTNINTLNEGEAFVDGRSPEKAAELLELADAAGLKGTVHTTSHGYIVPASILAGKGKHAEESAEQFDPSKATIEEVQAYLDGADDAERERVLAAEAEGKGRKALAPATPEGAK
jgi:hypothetical protein